MSITSNSETASDDMRATIDIREFLRLQAIENAAMRVASSRRNGIVTDQGALDSLDRLDTALEARP